MSKMHAFRVMNVNDLTLKDLHRLGLHGTGIYGAEGELRPRTALNRGVMRRTGEGAKVTVSYRLDTAEAVPANPEGGILQRFAQGLFAQNARCDQWRRGGTRAP